MRNRLLQGLGLVGAAAIAGKLGSLLQMPIPAVIDGFGDIGNQLVGTVVIGLPAAVAQLLYSLLFRKPARFEILVEVTSILLLIAAYLLLVLYVWLY